MPCAYGNAVGPALRVGGPATARGEWIVDFLEYVNRESVPIDYISTHIYPSDLAFIDAAEGDVELLGMDFLHQNFARVRDEVDAHRPGLPIIWGEWNPSIALPDAYQAVTCERILPGQGSAYEAWLDRGCPMNLEESDLAALNNASIPEKTCGSGDGTCSLPPGTVALLEYRRAP